MIAPEGYTSVFEVVSEGTVAGTVERSLSQTRVALEQVETFYAADQNGGIVKVPKFVITTFWSEFFVFVDEVSWTISFKKLRNGAENVGQPFSLPMGFFGLLGGQPFDPIPQVAESLLPLEHRSLVIRDTEAPAIIARLRDFKCASAMKRRLRGSEAEEAFKLYISDNPNSTAAEREAWGSGNLSGGREKARDLWRRLGPQGGGKSGPKLRN